MPEKFNGISCSNIDGFLRTFNDSFSLCCSDFGKNSSPNIKYADTPEKSVEAYKTLRKSIIEKLNSNENCACTGCIELRSGCWNAEPVLSYINFGFGNACNLRCSYCKSPNLKAKFEYDRLRYIFDFVSVLRAEGIASPDTRIGLASGEITVLPHCNEILESLSEYYCEIYSNGVIYNRIIDNMLSAGRAELICSIDAGTRHTFKKIKGCDVFNNVCETLALYSKNGGALF